MYLLMDIIKEQYFSQRNTNMLFKMFLEKFKDIDQEQLRNRIWNVQNQTYNNFIQKAYNKTIKDGQIEECLITLNKVTINCIGDNINKYNQQNENDVEQNENGVEQNENGVEQNENGVEQNENGVEQNENGVEQNENGVENIVEKNDIVQMNFNIEQMNFNIGQMQQIVKQTTEQLVEQIRVQNELKLEQNIIPTQEKTFLNFFSEHCINNVYTFNFGKQIKTFKIKSFSLLNNLYNISNGNNNFEINKTSIKIPIGNYNITDLCNTLNEKQTGYQFIYNKNKDRMTIKFSESDSETKLKNIHIEFKEQNMDVVQLKALLGFNKREYLHNESYTSENNTNLNIYDTLYIKIIEFDELNKYQTNNFNYACKFNFNSTLTFTQNIFIDLDENLSTEQSFNTLTLKFFYKSHEKFFKIPSPLTFNFVVEL
jgi:hypothetical protein